MMEEVYPKSTQGDLEISGRFMGGFYKPKRIGQPWTIYNHKLGQVQCLGNSKLSKSDFSTHVWGWIKTSTGHHNQSNLFALRVSQGEYSLVVEAKWLNHNKSQHEKIFSKKIYPFNIWLHFLIELLLFAFVCLFFLVCVDIQTTLLPNFLLY